MKKVITTLLIFINICLFSYILYKDNLIDNTSKNKINNIIVSNTQNVVSKEVEKENIKIDDWRLILVNYENKLPEDFEIELSNIDSVRKFDKRAIGELIQMLQDLKKNGVYNVWVQSAYRSINYQEGLFNDKINTYMKQGKTREEAEKLTLQTINRPGTSEHNLGLAVDFNYVKYSFENTKGFKWLQEKAENYGFILRYRKDKEDITKVDYEPWHWRYVGVEHAKKINELDICLEEYIEYLKNN